MRESQFSSLAESRPPAKRRQRPTRVLKHAYARDLVEALAHLFPAGRYPGVDSRGHASHLDVFVTRERRAKKHVVCGVRVLMGGSEFVLDDGADEFARTRMIGPPSFDLSWNVGISAVVRRLDGPARGCSLWVAHDLSALAVDDEVCFLR